MCLYTLRLINIQSDDRIRNPRPGKGKAVNVKGKKNMQYLTGCDNLEAIDTVE
jgi:hypothetical protein